MNYKNNSSKERVRELPIANKHTHSNKSNELKKLIKDLKTNNRTGSHYFQSDENMKSDYGFNTLLDKNEIFCFKDELNNLQSNIDRLEKKLCNYNLH